jgi:hypothetical protein
VKPRGRGRRADGTGHLGGGLVGIGGWLFADLLLALGLIFLVSMGVFALPQTPPPPVSPSPSPPPATPTPCVTTKSISNTPRTAQFDPAPNHVQPTNDQLARAFGAAPNEEEGLVQTQVTDADIDSAYKDAQWVNQQLRSGLLPGVITGNTHFDDLGWVDRAGDRWLIKFTIYPYVTRCVPQ